MHSVLHATTFLNLVALKCCDRLAWAWEIRGNIERHGVSWNISVREFNLAPVLLHVYVQFRYLVYSRHRKEPDNYYFKASLVVLPDNMLSQHIFTIHK